jgi:hypothetical protein
VSVFEHSVRAFLLGEWHEQPCASAPAASRLFDRLRQLNPALTVQRLHNGKAVEIADPWLAFSAVHAEPYPSHYAAFRYPNGSVHAAPDAGRYLTFPMDRGTRP